MACSRSHAARAAGVVGSKSGLMRCGTGPAGRSRAGTVRAGPRTSSRRRPCRSRGPAPARACAARPRSRGGRRCTRRSRACACSSRSLVGEEGPVGAGRELQLVGLVQVVGGTVTSFVKATGAPLVEAAASRADAGARAGSAHRGRDEHHRVVALQRRQPVPVAVLVRQLEVRAGLPGSRSLLMGISFRPGTWRHARGRPSADAVDARERGDVERAAVVVAPREVVRVLRQLEQAEALARRARGSRSPPGPQAKTLPASSTFRPSRASSPGAAVMSWKTLAWRDGAVRGDRVAHDDLVRRGPSCRRRGSARRARRRARWGRPARRTRATPRRRATRKTPQNGSSLSGSSNTPGSPNGGSVKYSVPSQR